MVLHTPTLMLPSPQNAVPKSKPVGIFKFIVQVEEVINNLEIVRWFPTVADIHSWDLADLVEM